MFQVIIVNPSLPDKPSGYTYKCRIEGQNYTAKQQNNDSVCENLKQAKGNAFFVYLKSNSYALLISISHVFVPLATCWCFLAEIITFITTTLSRENVYVFGILNNHVLYVI